MTGGNVGDPSLVVLHNLKFLMLVQWHSFLVGVEEPCYFGTVLGVPLVNISLSGILNLWHTKRLSAGIQELFWGKTKFSQKDRNNNEGDHCDAYLLVPGNW